MSNAFKNNLHSKPTFNLRKFEQNSETSTFRKNYKIKFSYLLLIISILSFVSIYNIAFNRTVKPVEINNIPLHEHDNSPFRSIPDDPGGMQFSYQDKAIYNSIKNRATDSMIGDKSNSITSINPQDIIQQLDEKLDVAVSYEDADSVFDILPEAEMIQIGIIKAPTASRAITEVKELQKKYPSTFEGKEYNVIKRDDIFIINIFGFHNKGEADDFCSKLKLQCEVLQ